MLKVLEFVFQDFTHWVGAFFLLTAFRPFDRAFKFSVVTRPKNGQE
jgi:hypothetical protein